MADIFDTLQPIKKDIFDDVEPIKQEMVTSIPDTQPTQPMAIENPTMPIEEDNTFEEPKVIPNMWEKPQKEVEQQTAGIDLQNLVSDKLTLPSMGKSLDTTSTIGQSKPQELTFKEKISNFFKPSWEKQRTRAGAVLAISDLTGEDFQKVDENLDAYTKELGIRGTPNMQEFIGTALILPMIQGLAANFGITALTVGGYTALDAILPKVKDALPEGAAEEWKDLADIVDMIGKGALAGKLSSVITKSTPYRMLTNRQRGLIVLNELEMKQAGWSEGKIIRQIKKQMPKTAGETLIKEKITERGIKTPIKEKVPTVVKPEPIKEVKTEVVAKVPEVVKKPVKTPVIPIEKTVKEVVKKKRTPMIDKPLNDIEKIKAKKSLKIFLEKAENPVPSDKIVKKIFSKFGKKEDQEQVLKAWGIHAKDNQIDVITNFAELTGQRTGVLVDRDRTSDIVKFVKEQYENGVGIVESLYKIISGEQDFQAKELVDETDLDTIKQGTDLEAHEVIKERVELVSDDKKNIAKKELKEERRIAQEKPTVSEKEIVEKPTEQIKKEAKTSVEESYNGKIIYPVRSGNKIKYAVATEKPALGDGIFETIKEAKNDIDTTNRIETSNKLSREKWKSEADKAKKEKENIYENNNPGLKDYLKTIESPMKRGKIKKTLEKLFRVNGVVKTRVKKITDLFKEGYEISEFGGKPILKGKDGSFFEKITNAEIEFFKHLKTLNPVSGKSEVIFAPVEKIPETKILETQDTMFAPSSKNISKKQNLSAKLWQINMSKEPITIDKINKTKIMNWIENTFKIPIKGKVTHKWKAAGAYYPQKQIIRMGKWGELAVVSHELAHHIDHVAKQQINKKWMWELSDKGNKKKIIKEIADLDYSPTARRTSEGFAEFVRHYLTTGLAKTKAPLFYDLFTNKLLKNNPGLNKSLNELKNMMDIWQGQGSENRILAQIDFRGEHTKIKGISKAKKVAMKAKEWLVKNWVDQMYVPEKIRSEIVKVTKKNINPTSDPVEMARYYKAKSGAIARTFVYENAIDEYSNVVGKGLQDILKPIKIDDMKTFISYGVAKRALLLSRRRKESGIDIDDAKYVLDKYKNKGFDTPIDELTEWSNHLIDWIVRAGGLGKKEASIIRDLNPVYLPFKRVFVDELTVMKAKSGVVDQGRAIKTLKGSGRPILNPIESLITQATELISKAHKIKIASLWADLAERRNVGGFITEIPAPMVATTGIPSKREFLDMVEKAGLLPIDEETGEPFVPYNLNIDGLLTIFSQGFDYKGKENVVTIWRNGKKKFYELDTDLYKALKEIDIQRLPAIIETLAVPFAKLVRLGATGLKLSFGLARNPFRDAFSYAVFSNSKGAKIWDPIKGIYKEFKAKPGDLEWRAKASGLGLAGMIGFDRESTMATYDELLNNKLGLKGKFLKVAKHPINTLQSILSFTELGPRMAELRKMYEQYRKDNPDWSEEDCYVKAYNDAQDVTINFTKSGYMGQKINRISAFFNVAIQGPEKAYRSFRDNPMRTIVRGLAWLTPLALGMWWKNKDKDWYKNLPHAYKYGNFFVELSEGNIVRLPIPFDLGVIFSSIPQIFADVMYNKDPKYIKGFIEQIKMQIPNITPSMFGPIIDIETNKNFLNVPIESKGDSFKHVTDRTRKWTTKTSKIMSKAFYKLGIKISPIQLDYLFNSYTGGFSRQLPGRKITQMADIPALGDLFLRSPEKPKRQMNEFFSDFEVLSQKKHSGIINNEEKQQLLKVKKLYKILIKDRFKRLKKYEKQENSYKEKLEWEHITSLLNKYGYK